MRYKNILDFYMLVNNLKDIKFHDKETIANHIYGEMVLAVSIDSEYELSYNLGKIIEEILLKSLITYNLDGVNKYFTGMPFDGYVENKKLKKHLSLFQKVDTVYSPNMESDCLFAFECLRLENIISKTTNLDNLSFKRINKECTEFGPEYEFVQDGFDKDKNNSVLNFYHLNESLKKKIRTGWDSTHWNIKGGNIETIAEHIVGTIGLAIAFDMNCETNIDIEKVITMLAMHEIGEIKIGDITPFDNVSKEEKKEIEHKAMKDVLKGLKRNNELYNLLLEFDEQKTPEAKFAHMCDKLEADIQSKVYYEKGLHHNLDDQENNVVFKNTKAREMLKEAKNPFDIWYLWDKVIYEESEPFTKTLEYVKDNNIRI